jgi:hypothetical protein
MSDASRARKQRLRDQRERAHAAREARVGNKVCACSERSVIRLRDGQWFDLDSRWHVGPELAA